MKCDKRKGYEMKICTGSCADNPFETTEKLDNVVEGAREITKGTFYKRCHVEELIKKDIEQHPHDYRFYKNKDVYFYEWSAIEFFYE